LRCGYWAHIVCARHCAEITINLQPRVVMVMKNILILALTSGFVFASAVGSKLESGQNTKELDEARMLTDQVVRLHEQGKYDEAIPLAKQALKLRETALGEKHVLVAVAMANLASLYLGKKDYSEAESHYRRAVSVYEKASSAETVEAAKAVEGLALASYGMGNDARAESLFLRALLIKEKVFGAEAVAIVGSLNFLAQFYEQSAKYKKSIEYYQRVIAIKEKVYGPEHTEVDEALRRCACVMRLNKDPMAELLEKRAYRVRVGRSVTGKVTQGKAIERVTPVYPEAARRARITGAINIEITVDENGKIIDAKYLCGVRLFEDAAVAAALKWRMKPTLLDDKPVKVRGTILFNFTP
jgi:TonB family protein